MQKVEYRANQMIKTYVSLTKPGIIWGNLIAATGGFMLAAQGNQDWFLFIAAMLGTCLVVASGCVFNNVIDTDIDALMDRTKNRALVEGRISRKSALIFACLLGIAGFSILAFFTNIYALTFGVFGFYVYVIMYSMVYKRSSIHGTLIGSASGASPPVIGYLAVAGQPDLAALLIFFGFCAWQMPHSYGIALFRKDDYNASSIPLLPLIKSLKYTQFQVLAYILVFYFSIIALFYYNYIGYVALTLLSVACVYWVYQAIALFKPNAEDFDESRWGKTLFITSIITITIYSVMLSIDYIVR